MEVSQQQLSKQDHYDYSLRSFLTPIARAAGVCPLSVLTCPAHPAQVIEMDTRSMSNQDLNCF